MVTVADEVAQRSPLDSGVGGNVIERDVLESTGGDQLDERVDDFAASLILQRGPTDAAGGVGYLAIVHDQATLPPDDIGLWHRWIEFGSSRPVPRRLQEAS